MYYEELEELYREIDLCEGCELYKRQINNKRARPLGNPDAQIMLIGEAPGKQEERLSKVFVGPAGKLLYKMLEAINLDIQEDVYITNIIHCRPTANKGSGKENETPIVRIRQTCGKLYFRRELLIVKPKILCLIGGVAATTILELPANTRIGSILGRHQPTIRLKEAHPGLEEVMVLYHPAAMLRPHDNLASMKRKQWGLLKELKELI